MQPLTRGPEADETKTMTVAWPVGHTTRAVPLSERRQGGSTESSALDLCGSATVARTDESDICEMPDVNAK